VLILNSYKTSPVEENSKWRNCVVIGDEDYDLLACGSAYSVGNLPKFWRNVLFEDDGATFLQNKTYSVTFQKTIDMTFFKMYSCCYRRMQTLFFLLNTVTILTVQF